MTGALALGFDRLRVVKKKVNVWFLGFSYRAERDSSVVLS